MAVISAGAETVLPEEPDEPAYPEDPEAAVDEMRWLAPRRGAAAAVLKAVERVARVAGDPLSDAVVLGGLLACAPWRAVFGFDGDPTETGEVFGELPVEPAGPVEGVPSADAMGIAPIAEPTPSATASAPTRPT